MPRSDKPLSTPDVLNKVLDFDNSRLNVDLSELPAAAALGDALANPTTSMIGAALLGWDGTQWRRIKSDAGAGNDLRTQQFVGGSRAAAGADSVSGHAGTNSLAEEPYYYNGTNFDAVRNNIEVTVLASAARTASTNSADQTNFNARGIMVWLDITVVPGVDTVQLTIEAKDPTSGKYIQLLADTAQSATGTRTVIVYPGAGAAADGINLVRGFPLPRTWRVRIVHSAGSSFTYSVGASYIS